MKKHITIQDVASDSGLSTATISRALNEPWLVKEATLEEVHKSVAKLGYRPNVGAQMLARGKSGKTICFLLSNRPFVHSIHAQVLQGAADQAEVDKACVLYTTCNYSPNDPPLSIGIPHILATRGLIDGIIVAGTNYANIIPVLDQVGLPYVIFGTNLIADEETVANASVFTDDEGGGYQATRHLIDRGHRTIRFIGDVSLPWYRRRYQGYLRALAEAGISSEPPLGSSAHGEMQMGFDSAGDLCEQAADFTALFVAGDEGAIGAIRALRSYGKGVPADVSVVGFNDEELAQISDPQLTTVRVPKEEAGSECVRMLQNLIKHPDKAERTVVLLTELIERESTREV